MKTLIFLLFVTFLFAGCSRLSPLSKLGSPRATNYTFASPTLPAVATSAGGTQPIETLPDAIKRQLAAKYNKSPNDVNVTVSQESNGYAKGSINFAGEQGGAIWFAALEKGGWILVGDGQGPLLCDKVNEYQFPNTFIPSCLQNGKIIKR